MTLKMILFEKVVPVGITTNSILEDSLTSDKKSFVAQPYSPNRFELLKKYLQSHTLIPFVLAVHIYVRWLIDFY